MYSATPSEKDTVVAALETRLRDAAEQFRANSGLKSQAYSAIVLGPIFLRFAAQRARLESPPLCGEGSVTVRGVDHSGDSVEELADEAVEKIKETGRFRQTVHEHESKIKDSGQDSGQECPGFNPGCRWAFGAHRTIMLPALSAELIDKLPTPPVSLHQTQAGRFRGN